MTSSSRWSIGLGISSALVCAALAVLAFRISDHAPPRAAEPAATAPIASALAQEPEAIDSAAAPSAPVAPERGAAMPPILPPIDQGPRNRTIELAVRPLLVAPRLRAGVFGVDLQSGAFFDLLGSESYAAASLIKIPIAVVLLSEIDRGAVRLDEILSMQAGHVATGSGAIQYQPVGTRFSIGRLAEIMIRRSDNTATNMLIDRLGGIAYMNQAFAAWGLPQTVLRAPLPDLAGTNRTSPRDLVTILGRAVSGDLLRSESRELLLSWMRRTHVRSLLPSGIGPGARVANKTGDIPGALGDAGYVEAGAQRYLLAVQVERPRNSGRAKELIRSVSRTVYHSITGRSPQAPARVPRARAGLRRPAIRARSRT